MKPLPGESRNAAAKRRIVVDADVARSAGKKDSASDVARRCRACLDAILDICHSVVMNEQLEREWNRHASRYSSIWLTAMKSKRKYREPAEDAPAQIELEDAARGSDDAEKDIHLLAAALATDGIVVSNDDRAAKAIAKRCGRVAGVADVIWVCPKRNDNIIQWLEQGAPKKAEWTLGQRKAV